MGLEDSFPHLYRVKDSSREAWMGNPLLIRRLCASHGENLTRPRVHVVHEELPMTRMPKMWFGLLALVFLLGLSVSAFAADAKGKIKSVDADKNQFVLTDSNGKDWTILIA